MKLAQSGDSYRGDCLAFNARSTLKDQFFSDCGPFSVSSPSESTSKSAGSGRSDEESHVHLVRFVREWAHRRHWAPSRVVFDLFPLLTPSRLGKVKIMILVSTGEALVRSSMPVLLARSPIIPGFSPDTYHYRPHGLRGVNPRTCWNL